MRKLVVVLEYVVMLLILTAFWFAITVAGLVWIGSGHGLFAFGQDMGGDGAVWVMLAVFGYGWLMTMIFGVCFGPRGMLELFEEVSG